MKNRFGPDGITFPCKMDTNTDSLKFMKEHLLRVYFLPKKKEWKHRKKEITT